MRRWLAPLIMVAWVAAGCTTPGTPEVREPPIVRIGDSVTYVSGSGNSYIITLNETLRAMDADGNLRDAFFVSMRGTGIPVPDPPGYGYVVDLATNRVLQERNLCGGGGNISSGDCVSSHVRVAWLDGYPWLFGASLLMFERLTPGGAISAEVPGPGGIEQTVTFSVAAEGNHLIVSPRDDEMDLPAPLAFPGTYNARFEFDESPYPLRISIRETNFTLVREAWQPGDGQELTLGEGGWTPLPKPSGFAAVHGTPPTDGTEPPAHPLKEALEFAESNDSQLRAFLNRYPEAYLVDGLMGPRQTMGAGPATLQTYEWTLQFADLESRQGHVVVIQRTYVAGALPRDEVVSSRAIEANGPYPRDPSEVPGRQISLEAAFEKIRRLELPIEERSYTFDLRSPGAWWPEPRYAMSIFGPGPTEGLGAGLGYIVTVAGHTGQFENALLPPEALSKL